MLARQGPLPEGPLWSFELKWDGFRAIISTEEGLRVRSRRGWNMTAALPEFRELPRGLVLDGELVSLNRQGEPHFPSLCRRILMGNRAIPVKLIVFDLLREGGEDLMNLPLRVRRARLEALGLNASLWRTPETFFEGRALFEAVCDLGLEGVVAKRLDGRYRPGERRWIKIKNPAYWRREWEIESLRRAANRRTRSQILSGV